MSPQNERPFLKGLLSKTQGEKNHSVTYSNVQFSNGKYSQNTDSEAPAGTFLLWGVSVVTPPARVYVEKCNVTHGCPHITSTSPPSLSNPPTPLALLPFPSCSLCASEHHSWLLRCPAEGCWVTCHRQKRNMLIYVLCSCLSRRWKGDLNKHVIERLHGIMVRGIRSPIECHMWNSRPHQSRMKKTPLWWRPSFTPLTMTTCPVWRICSVPWTVTMSTSPTR